MSVVKKDIIDALERLGVCKDDTIIVHSSLKSFGYVEGGAETVLDALKSTVCEGTLVFPSLRMRNFYNAYKDWDVNKTPSDVGLLSEMFRLSPSVLRSNQQTHAVCAIGKDAEYLTEKHGEGKNRIGVFGDTPFSISSPWQKMYEIGAKVVMIGVSMKYNTFKHFVEYKIINDIIDNIEDEKLRKEASSKISRFKDTAKYYLDGEIATSPDGVWLWHDALKSQEKMETMGYLKETLCGNSKIICFAVNDYVNYQYKAMTERPEEWFRPDAVEWINKYKN